MISPKPGDIIEQSMLRFSARAAEYYEILDGDNCRAIALRRHSGQIHKYANNSLHKWVVYKNRLYISRLENWQLGEIQQTPHDEECCILDEDGLFELWCWLFPIVELPR